MKCVSLLTIVLGLSSGETGEYRNSLDIDNISNQIQGLRERVKADLDSIEKVANISHSERGKIYNYIDDSIANVVKPLLKGLHEIRNNTEANLARLEESMKTNFEKLQSTNAVNSERMIEGFVAGKDSALTKNAEALNARAKSIEDIISTRLSVCAHKRNNKIPGTVMEFDDILHKATDISKIIRVLGENLEVRDVFQTGRGNFIVPKGASGEYWISISILMDVFGWHHSLAGNKTAFVMSNYRLMVDGHNAVPEAMLFSDAGTSESADLVQASRSIVLHLNEGQVLTLEKVDLRIPASPNTETDKRITFCISLNHLDKALKLGALPAVLPAPSPISLQLWTYTAPPPVSSTDFQDISLLPIPAQAALQDVKKSSLSTPPFKGELVPNPV